MQIEPNRSWPEPLTFGGVAAFAHAPAGRFWIFQTVVALLAAVVVSLSFEVDWAPVISHTIQALPAAGEIQDGTLIWTRPAPIRTAESSFLWISIDPADSLEPSQGADFQIEFGRNECRFGSLFGYLVAWYPEGFVIALNRTELDPWWGAWHPAITVGIGAATFIGLLIAWGVLAVFYSWPVRLICFYADRRLPWGGAWRLSAAALLPGSLFFTLAILAYSFQRINLLQLMAAGALHFMIGWIYLLFAPFCLPRNIAPGSGTHPDGNPFAASKSKAERRQNPFANPSESGDNTAG